MPKTQFTRKDDNLLQSAAETAHKLMVKRGQAQREAYEHVRETLKDLLGNTDLSGPQIADVASILCANHCEVILCLEPVLDIGRID